MLQSKEEKSLRREKWRWPRGTKLGAVQTSDGWAWKHILRLSKHGKLKFLS